MLALIKTAIASAIPSLIQSAQKKAEARRNAQKANEILKDEGVEDIVVVPTKPMAESKIAWASVIGPLASAASGLLAYYGYDLSPDQIVGIVFAVQTIQSLLTWAFRKWFTGSVTEASMR